MKANGFEFHFMLTVEEDTGKFLAAYFQFRAGKAAKVKEYAEGRAYANYSARGKLLGIEILAPCEIRVLDQITRGEPQTVKKFVKDKAPRELVIA